MRTLFTYWRSQASFRVRIALRLKGLEADSVPLDLLKGDQFDVDYHALNAATAVPTLIDGEGPPLVQSLAILEYLDEKYPDPPLLPADLRARAHVRALAQMAAVDAHPFIVPRVRRCLEEQVGLDEPGRVAWVRHWLDEASRAIEDTLVRDPRTGTFCCGETATIADICLVAHLASAQLFGATAPETFPTAHRIVMACMRSMPSRRSIRRGRLVRRPRHRCRIPGHVVIVLPSPDRKGFLTCDSRRKSRPLFVPPERSRNLDAEFGFASRFAKISNPTRSPP